MSVPTCAACGKRLPKFVDRAKFPRDANGRIVWSKDYSKSHVAPETTGDGAPPTRGRLGDNVVCGQVCGYNLLIRILAAEPGVLRLLPPGHDPKVIAEAAIVKRRERARKRRVERKLYDAKYANT